LMSITHPDDVQEDLDNIVLLNAGEIDGYHMEKRYLHHDGTTVWINMTIAPVKVEDKAHPRHICMIEDITEMKKAQEALRKANELLRLAVVVHDAHDAITVQGLDGRILAWNPGAVRMYGWSEAEALMMNVRDRIPEGLREEALAKVHQLSQAKIMEPYHTQRITKGGTVVEVSMVSTALVNEARQMYAIATTERAEELKSDRTMEAHHEKQGEPTR
ncbi:MAG: PAS domain S-box protein, partial [Candidatus Atribacteria bacterium]|nr:PAS domain S-box protein [Candidatus Atribacteria bacterium]